MSATIADVLEGRARWCVVEARPKRRPNVSVKCQRPGCLMWRTLYWHPSRPLPQFCSIGCRNAVTVATRTDVGRGGADHWSWRGDSIKRRSGWSRAERSFPMPTLCERCNERPAKDRHHVDGNTRNNDPANVRCLCRRCHMIEDGRLAKLGRTIGVGR